MIEEIEEIKRIFISRLKWNERTRISGIVFYEIR